MAARVRAERSPRSTLAAGACRFTSPDSWSPFVAVELFLAVVRGAAPWPGDPAWGPAPWVWGELPPWRGPRGPARRATIRVAASPSAQSFVAQCAERLCLAARLRDSRRSRVGHRRRPSATLGRPECAGSRPQPPWKRTAGPSHRLVVRHLPCRLAAGPARPIPSRPFSASSLRWPVSASISARRPRSALGGQDGGAGAEALIFVPTSAFSRGRQAFLKEPRRSRSVRVSPVFGEALRAACGVVTSARAYPDWPCCATCSGRHAACALRPPDSCPQPSPHASESWRGKEIVLAPYAGASFRSRVDGGSPCQRHLGGRPCTP